LIPVLAAGLFIAGLTFAMVLYPYRYWARPPVELSIGPDGLGFHLASGRNLELKWSNSTSRIAIVLREDDPDIPVYARFRLFIDKDGLDAKLPWRRVIPLVYVPKQALDSILAHAESAGLGISTTDVTFALTFQSSMRKPCKSVLLGHGVGWKGWRSSE